MVEDIYKKQAAECFPHGRGESFICQTAMLKGMQVTATKSQRRCRYHRLDSEKYHLDQLSPDGLCMHAFHSAYATCLKFLYSDRCHNRESVLMCPEARVSLRFKVMTADHSRLTERLRNKFKYYLRRIGIPCDYQSKRILIKIISSQSPCPKGHQAGDTFEFNLGNKSEICPASFESLYPVVYGTHARIILQQHSGIEKNGECLYCPSHAVGIRYRLARE